MHPHDLAPNGANAFPRGGSRKNQSRDLAAPALTGDEPRCNGVPLVDIPEVESEAALVGVLARILVETCTRPADGRLLTLPHCQRSEVA